MCSRAILVIIDPILLLRKHRAGGHETLAHCGASGLYQVIIIRLTSLDSWNQLETRNIRRDNVMYEGDDT